MPRAVSLALSLGAAVIVMTAAALHAQPQEKGGSNIVCWKDKAGKTIGCGDKVPLEYQDNASRELNKRGMTVRQTEAALTPEQRQAQAAEAQRKRLLEQKMEDEKRRDRALLDSFTTEKEIDLKRTRDIQQIEINIAAQQTNLKNISDRQTEVKTRIDNITRLQKPVPAQLQDDLERLAREKTKTQAQILEKRKEIVERNLEYEAMKTRFMQLKGAAETSTATTAGTGGETPRK